MTTPEDEREHWDTLASDQSNIGGVGMPAPEWFVEHVTRHLDLPLRSTVVELGCGVGRIASQMTATVYAVDISQEMLDQIDSPNVIPVQGNGRTIPIQVPSVDGAYSVLMFQHIPADAVLGYLHSVFGKLVTGGRFVAQWVTEGPKHDYSHPLTPSAMQSHAEDAGFRLLDMWTDRLVREWMWACWEKP